MKQTTAPKLTPSPSSTNKRRAVADQGSGTKLFVTMVFDMSWRLAIVVLAPIITGIELDKHFKTSYTYLLFVLALAIVLATLVVYRSYQLANKLTGKTG